MQTEVVDLAQTDGWVALTPLAERALIQLRTSGNVEIVIASAEPAATGIQGFLLTETGPSVFQVTGMDDTTDMVWGRVLGTPTDTDTLVVLHNGAAVA